jgi:hypothetical protein
LGYCPEERQQVFSKLWQVPTKQQGITCLKIVNLMLCYSDKIKSHSQLPVCMITAYGGEDGKNIAP